MGKRIKKFPVKLFVDQEEGESNACRLEVELVDRKNGAVFSERIVEGSLRVRPYLEPLGENEGEKAPEPPDCIAISEMAYAEGKARFRVQVKEEFIRDPDFLRKVTEPIYYTVEAKPKPGKKERTPREPIMHVLDFRLSVASIHWKWWPIIPEEIPTVAPPDAEEDTSIRLDPDGTGGFRLELMVREFNPLTGQFDVGGDECDWVHDLGRKGGKITAKEVAARPSSWKSEDLQQKFSNWFSERDLLSFGADFGLPCEDVMKVVAYPKNSIVRRLSEAPYVDANLPKVATRRIPVRLERFDFVLWKIDGGDPRERLPLSAAAENIPSRGYKLTLKIFNDGAEAEGVRVKVGFRKEGGRESFGEIVGGAAEELMTGADGTADFYYRPRVISLRPDDFRREVEFEERFEVFARRSERCRPYKLRERGVLEAREKGKDRPSLTLVLEPELKLKFFKKPFIFRAPEAEQSTGDRVEAEAGASEAESSPPVSKESVRKGLEPFAVDLGSEMGPGDRKRLAEIIDRGGELHLKAILSHGQSGERMMIRDGSWCSGEENLEGEVLDKWDVWLDAERREVCVLKFPVTGRSGGVVAEPLEFEGKFGVIEPIGSQLERIEDRAREVDESLGTSTVRKKARRFVGRCLERIASEGEEKIDRETESIFETIATVSCFLRGTKLSKDAMELSFDLQGKVFRRFRETFINAFGEILSFRPVGEGLRAAQVSPVGKLEEGLEETPAGQPGEADVSVLIREYLLEGRAGARRAARRLARQFPGESCAAAEKLLREARDQVTKEAAVFSEESESEQKALKTSTKSLIELARKIVPLNQARMLQKRTLKMLNDELSAFVKAAEIAQEELVVITGRIADLRKMAADSGAGRAAEMARLEGLRMTAKKHADEEAAAFAESEDLAEGLKGKSKETQAAKAMRDSAKEKLEGFTREKEGLDSALRDAETKSDSCETEVDRLKSAIANSSRAREAAIGRQDGLEKKLGDRKGATVSSERDVRLASEEAKRFSELVREKKAGREGLIENLKSLGEDLDSLRRPEMEARKALDRESRAIDDLKRESPPNAAKIREAEKARVEASRNLEIAGERLSEQALRAERAERALRDSERTIEELHAKERGAQRLVEERKDARLRARRLENEQTEMVESNAREIERLRDEVVGLQRDLEVATKMKVDAAATMVAVSEAVSRNEVELAEARSEFSLTNKIFTEFEAARAGLEKLQSESVADLKIAKGRLEGSRENVLASEDRLANLKEGGEALGAKEASEVLQEAGAKKRRDAAAEKLKKQEKEIADTKMALEETERELEPLTQMLSETREKWKEARANEAVAYGKHAEKSLEERNLADWEKKLGELKKESAAISYEEPGEVAPKLWALAESIPGGETRLALIGNHVGEVVDRRAANVKEWVGGLEALPVESGEAIERDELLASWEEYQSLGAAEAKDRLTGGVESLWSALEGRVAQALPASDAEMTRMLAELKSEPPPSDALEFEGDGLMSWAERVEEIDGTMDWIDGMQKKGSGPLAAWVPDAVASFFSDRVYDAFVEGLSWIQLVMVNFSRETSALLTEAASIDGSVLSDAHRVSAREFIDAKELCSEEFFTYVPKAELTLAEKLSPDKLFERVGSENDFAEMQKSIEEEVARGYDSRFGAQRLRAGGVYESLCLEALDPIRIEKFASVESLRQRRKVVALQEAVTKRMGEFWEVFTLLEKEKKASVAELLALGARSRLQSGSLRELLDWVAWALTWSVRSGAIVSSISGREPAKGRHDSGDAIEEVCGMLRLGCSAAQTYPEVLAFQRDLLLVESLAFQALFEGYQLPDAKALVEEGRRNGEVKGTVDDERV